ncbi:MAG TPA: EAL domain-containing protein [Gammaproteobacteria bacterium]|nr:EAL domain-containing protein [Gammaproteobacteria bacterium]
MYTPDKPLDETRIFQALRSIGNISEQTQDLETVLHRSMEEVLSIFNADRAWVIHPCDPAEAFFNVKVECTRANWPGIFTCGESVPADDVTSEIMRKCLASKAPLLINISEDQAFYETSELHERFPIYTQLCIALYPENDKPWLLGLHYCERERTFSELEIQFFSEIAHRIEVAISNKLFTAQLRHSEERLKSHMRYLNAMERVSRIISGKDSIESMLQNVLSEMLALFDCDRAWLLYPCDPNTKYWCIPMAQDRPDWPGIALGVDVPLTSFVKKLIENALLSNAALTFNVEDQPAFKNDSSTSEFHIKSQMLLPIFPKVGKPWLLGIHHCSRLVRYSDEERVLFKEIGCRIANSLTTLITLRDLRESEEQFRTLVENAPEAIFVLDVVSGLITQANGNATSLFKKTHAELLKIKFTSLASEFQPYGSCHPSQLKKFIDQAVNGLKPVFECRFIDARQTPIECEVRLVRLPARDSVLLRGSITDITERKHAEARMHMLSSALEQTADAVMVTDENGMIEYVNPACEMMTGYSFKETFGKKANHLYSGQQSKKFYKNLWRTIKSGQVFSEVFVNRRKNGSLYYEEKTITPLHNPNGEITNFISTGRDISARMETQKQLEYLAHHDALTQLPNRVLLMDRLDHAIGNANRQKSSVAVLFLDLDRFKIINDTLGHDIGDHSLKQVSAILTNHLRKVDTVARLGGDEFAILLEDINSTEEIKRITEKILNAFSKPFRINNHEVFLTTSIGISLYPKDGNDTGELLKNADIAMYRAKGLGRNTYEFYQKAMSNDASNRLAMETKLRRALEHQEFFLLYQPFISIDTGQLVGAEALIRWQPQGMQTVLPIEFISILEETGLIVPVGEWVLETACAQLKKWQGAGATDLRMAVNLSSRQLLWDGLESSLKKTLHRNNLKEGSLELEITESLLIEQNDYTLSMLNRINDMGIRLSLDDFGTGYSSLSYLKRFPVDILKIDRSFTRDMTVGDTGTSLVEAILAMAKSLRLRTIAEGVETAEQLRILKRLNCQSAQGYHFSKPVTAAEFERLLISQRWHKGK